MHPELEKKDLSIENMAREASRDKKVLSELFEGILSKKDTIRFNSFKVLSMLSKTHPEALYSHWKYFADLLKSDNNYTKYIAIHLIADLTKVDTEHRFEALFDTYYSALEGEKTMVAAHVAALSGKIARHNPELQPRITEKLLAIDRIHRGKQKELVKGHAIEAFDEYFGEIEKKEEVMRFVEEQLKSRSPKTRKIAKEFLEKWEPASEKEI